MEYKTKKTYEFRHDDLLFLKDFERRYRVKLVIYDGRRVDKYEIMQSYRESLRSAEFMDVAVPLRIQILMRYMYYEGLKLKRKEIIKRLCSEFIRSRSVIEEYLALARCCYNDESNLYENERNIINNIRCDPEYAMPMFNWSATRKKDLYPLPEYKGNERKTKREQAVCARYILYSHFLGYCDVDAEYLVCYRDFDITPRQLQLFRNRSADCIIKWGQKRITMQYFRELFPMYTWSIPKPPKDSF